MIQYGDDREDEPDLLADMRNAAWLDEQVFPPLEYAVPGLVPEGMTLMCGPPKVGKSWLLLGLALAIACGGRALGALPVQRRPVLLFALEDGDRRLQERCRTLLPRESLPRELDYITRVRAAVVRATAAAWMRLHEGKRPVVILDTLGKVSPPPLPGEGAYARDYRIGGEWKALADAFPGSSVLINHHVRKQGSEDFVDSVSGTAGLAGSADTIIIVRRARHEPAGLLTVTGRDVAEEEYAAGFGMADGSWTLDGGSLPAAIEAAKERKATMGVGDRMSEVIRCVHSAGKPIRAQQVADALGMTRDDAGRYLRRAAEAGRIAKHVRGLYAPLSVPSEVSETGSNVIPFGHNGHNGQGSDWPVEEPPDFYDEGN